MKESQWIWVFHLQQARLLEMKEGTVIPHHLRMKNLKLMTTQEYQAIEQLRLQDLEAIYAPAV